METTDAAEQHIYMYDQIRVQGKKLSEWAEMLHHQYSLGELYRLAKDGIQLDSLMPERQQT